MVVEEEAEVGTADAAEEEEVEALVEAALAAAEVDVDS